MASDDPALLVVRPGTITQKDRAALRKVGVVVVEHERPEEVKFLRPHADLSGSALLLASMKALSRDGMTNGYINELGKAKMLFANEIARMLQEQAGEAEGGTDGTR